MLGGRGSEAARPTRLRRVTIPSSSMGWTHRVRVLLPELLLVLIDIGEGGCALQSSTQ